jgi:cytochrome c2
VHIGTNHHRHVFSGGKLGLRVFILTILLGLLWSTGPYFYKGHKGCVECHTPHFETDGTCVDCHRGDPRTNRSQIAHYQLIQGEYACFTLPDSPVVKDGHRLINISACRRCHQTGLKGNTPASNLDATLDKTLPEILAHAIKNPAIFMPNFYFHESDILKLVNAILASSAVYVSDSSETARIIHFEKDKEDSDNMFNKHCGSCHRVLTQQLGSLGQGDIGPNLSGLFSEFYFKNFKDGKPWNASRLKQWLKNPRDIRVNTQMPPIEFTEDNLRHLIHIINS